MGVSIHCSLQTGHEIDQEGTSRSHKKMAVHVPTLAVFSASSLRKFTRWCSRRLVTSQEINAFQDKGAICLRGVFKDWVENLKRGIADNHRNPSEKSEWHQSKDSETFYFNDYCNWRKIPEFEQFVLESPAAEIAGKLMKSEVTSSIVVYEVSNSSL